MGKSVTCSLANRLIQAGFILFITLPIAVKTSSTIAQTKNSTILINDSFLSRHLGRTVTLTCIYPATPDPSKPWSVLLVFDGQDFRTVRVQKAVDEQLTEAPGHPMLVVGIHANEERLQEYGIASQPDYANRGTKAGLTTKFVINELIPHLHGRFPLSKNPAEWSVAGFSLGGLMALDLVWHHPAYFARVGVFSGSFWWRQRALENGYLDSDRIMHRLIREGRGGKSLKFWFQTGTHDEKDDRDNDGVIDSIDDTLDLIAELERQGYAWGRDISYVEVPEGEHNPTTWAKVFPTFLKWLWAEKQ